MVPSLGEDGRVTGTSVEKTIESVIQSRFPGGKIEQISIRRDFDYDDDPILVIEVVIQTGEVLDSRRATGLARHLRSALAGIGETSFPLFSFISKNEAGKLRTAAA